MLRALTAFTLLTALSFPLHAEAWEGGRRDFYDRVYRQEIYEGWDNRDYDGDRSRPYVQNNYYENDWNCPKRGRHRGYRNGSYHNHGFPPQNYYAPQPQVIYTYPPVHRPNLVIQYGF
jgi:hypothetical protein